MEWQIIKMTDSNALGIQKKGCVKLYDYEVLECYENEKQAYERMKIKAEELSIYGMKYKHLQ
jgi:hypothetical protein